MHPAAGNWGLQFGVVAGGDLLFWAGATLLLMALLMIWCYRREMGLAGLRVEWRLPVLRLLALAAVALALLEPATVRREHRAVARALPILIDVSTSMSFSDAYLDEDLAVRQAAALGLASTAALRGASRLELACQALARVGLAPGTASPALREWLPFARELAPAIDSFDGLQADGSATAIAAAIDSALAHRRQAPLAGLVLVTDGVSNHGAESAAAVAACRAAGVSLTVLYAGGDGAARNVRVDHLQAEPAVFTGDAAQLEVTVASTGSLAAAGVLELSECLPGGEWTTIESRELELPADGRQLVSFTIEPATAGSCRYRAAFTCRQDELTAADNQVDAAITVHERRLRVLFVAAVGFPEVQFLRQTMLRDPTVDCSTWLTEAPAGYPHAGDHPLQSLPAPADLAAYDCIILFDVDSTAWPPGWSDGLMRFVSHDGGGLISVAGEQRTAEVFAAQDQAEAGWLRLLPIVPTVRATGRLTLTQRFTEGWRLEVTDAGRQHPLFQFFSQPAANVALLAQLPLLYWYLPVTRAKAGAVVLARYPAPELAPAERPPLLATQLYGAGRVFWLGCDSSYRWRSLDDRYFERFWSQLIDAAGRSKRLGLRHQLSLHTRRRSWQPGELVQFEVSWPVGAVAGAGDLRGSWQQADGPVVPLTFESDGAHARSGFRPLRSGVCLIKVWTGAQGGAERPAQLNLEITPAASELAVTSGNLSFCRELATATGGQVCDWLELEKLTAGLELTPLDEVHESRRALWQSPLWLLFFAACLTIEWLWRRQRGLV